MGNPDHESSGAPPAAGTSARVAIGTLADYLRVRLELAGLEGREAAAHVVKILVLGVAAAMLLGWGYLFLWGGGIALIAEAAELEWPAVAMIVGGSHAALAVVLLLVIRSRLRRPLFSVSIEQFQKDREWLKQKKNPQS